MGDNNRSGFAFEALETRHMLSISGLDAKRQYIYDAFTPEFQAALDSRAAVVNASENNYKFDQALLDLMRAVPGQAIRPSNVKSGLVGGDPTASYGRTQFFYAIDAAGANTPYVTTVAEQAKIFPNTDLDVPGAVIHAEGLASDQAYHSDPSSGLDPEYHRHQNWPEWANAYRYGKDDGVSHNLSPNQFVQKIVDDLAAWATNVNVTLNNAREPYTYNIKGGGTLAKFGGDLLDMAERVINWTTVYPMIVESTSWDRGINTSFFYHLLLQSRSLNANAQTSSGGFLYDYNARRATAGNEPDIGFSPVDHNKIINQAQALLYSGTAFQEFASAGDWRSTSRDILFGPMLSSTDRDESRSEILRAFYDDGGSREVSDSYTQRSLRSLLSIAELDIVSGNAYGNNTWQWWDNQIDGDPRSRRFSDFLGDIEAHYYQTIQPSRIRESFGDSSRGDKKTGVKGLGTLVFGDEVLTKLTQADTSGRKYNALVPQDREVIDFADAWLVGSVKSNRGSPPGVYSLPGRGFSNSAIDFPKGGGSGGTRGAGVGDSGFFVFRSKNAGDPGDRQALFHGANPDGTSDGNIGSAGEGPHTDRDLLNFTYTGWGQELIVDLGKDNYFDRSGFHNVLTPYTNGIADSTKLRSATQHRQYEPYQNIDNVPVVTRGRWDNQSGSGYRQATSWTNAWDDGASRGKVGGGGNASIVARSVWELNNETLTNLVESSYGVAVVIDYAKKSNQIAGQRYDTRFNINALYNDNSLSSYAPQTTQNVTSYRFGKAGAKSSATVQITPVANGPTTFAPSIIATGTGKNFPSDRANIPTFVSSTGTNNVTDAEVMVAHVISSGTDSSPPPRIDARWTDVLGTSRSLVLNLYAQNGTTLIKSITVPFIVPTTV